MDLFGTVIAGALKGQEIMAVKNGEMFQGIGTLQIGKDRFESLAEESGRVDKVQPFAETDVGRSLGNSKECSEIMNCCRSGCLTSGTLVKVQERERFEVEYRKP